MNAPTTDETKKLHDFYCNLVAIQLPFSMQRHYLWEHWCSRGFTECDLRDVVRYIKARIQDGYRQRESLKFSNLIGDTERFEEDLSMAIARQREARAMPDPNRQSVLTQTGRSSPILGNTARTAEQVIRGDAALKELLKVRDSL